MDSKLLAAYAAAEESVLLMREDIKEKSTER